jgi:GNAT superfamily N-acetyltransferase
VIVRKPRADEIDNILIVMEYYRDEADLPDGEYDADAMLETVRDYMIHADQCWFNLYEGSRVVGIIGGYVAQIPWSHRLMAHIQFVYTLPSHRNLTNARMLVDRFTQWSQEMGAVKISAGDIGIDTERTRAFYQQVGFSDTGCWLSKELSQ